MTAKQVMAMITDVIVSVPLIIGFFYLIYLILKGKDITENLTKNPKRVFESIIILSTFLEVLSLSILGLERGIPLSACLSRYGLAGTLELLTAFLCSSAISKALNDGEISSMEGLQITVFFITSLLVTSIIYVFYLEANGYIVFTGLMDYTEKKGRIELGAMFTIWCTVPLNLLNILFQIKQKHKTKK